MKIPLKTKNHPTLVFKQSLTPRNTQLFLNIEKRSIIEDDENESTGEPPTVSESSSLPQDLTITPSPITSTETALLTVTPEPTTAFSEPTTSQQTETSALPSTPPDSIPSPSRSTPTLATLYSVDAKDAVAMIIESHVKWRYGKFYEGALRGDFSSCIPYDPDSRAFLFRIGGERRKHEHRRQLEAFDEIISHDQTRRLTKDHVFPIDMFDTRRLQQECILAFNRRSNSNDIIIWPLAYESARFTDMDPDGHSWLSKKEVLFWRGSTTGPVDIGTEERPQFGGERVSRVQVVQRWFGQSDLIDIGFSDVVQVSNKVAAHLRQLTKRRVAWKAQLKYKYLLAMEGNDCATNFVPILASNSVAFATYPFMWNCLEHGVDLKPWVHFVPVALNGSDLLEKVRYCMKNDAECEAISKQAQQAIKPLTDSRIYNGILDRMVELWNLKNTTIKRIRNSHVVNNTRYLNVSDWNNETAVWIERQVASRYGKHYEAAVNGSWNTCTPIDLSIAFSYAADHPVTKKKHTQARNEKTFVDIIRHDQQNRLTSKHIFPIDMADARPYNDCRIAYNRLAGTENLIMWPLDFDQKRFTEIVEDEVEWDNKIPTLFWRGSTTGPNLQRSSEVHRVSRVEVVQRWWQKHPQIDLALTNVIQIKNPSLVSELLPYSTAPVRWRSQLTYKYLLSMEGNDCASNLPHILASRSVAFAAYPFMWNCIEHGLDLQPWVHFVPVAIDGSDLLEKFEWCRLNDMECHQITLRANEAIKPLLNRKLFDAVLYRMIELWNLQMPQVDEDSMQEEFVDKKPRAKSRY